MKVRLAVFNQCAAQTRTAEMKRLMCPPLASPSSEQLPLKVLHLDYILHPGGVRRRAAGHVQSISKCERQKYSLNFICDLCRCRRSNASWTLFGTRLVWTAAAPRAHRPAAQKLTGIKGQDLVRNFGCSTLFRGWIWRVLSGGSKRCHIHSATYICSLSRPHSLQNPESVGT